MNEERFMVLKMLAEGKVTVEQAEQLIDALQMPYESSDAMQDRQMYEAAIYSFNHDTAPEAPSSPGGFIPDAEDSPIAIRADQS